MRFVLLSMLTALVAGCGSVASPPSSAPPIVEPPPGQMQQGNGPPRAWLETTSGSTWLSTGSYCWTDPRHSLCVDGVAPSCDVPSVPHVEVAPNETVHAHLGFDPTEASVEGASPALHGRTVSWKASRDGAFSLFTRLQGGDVSYYGCADFTTKPSAYSGPA
jgi:hypothetical protein